MATLYTTDVHLNVKAYPRESMCRRTIVTTIWTLCSSPIHLKSHTRTDSVSLASILGQPVVL
jgi:hypothetical protein